MREIRTSGSTSGQRRPGYGPSAPKAPLFDSTYEGAMTRMNTPGLRSMSTGGASTTVNAKMDRASSASMNQRSDFIAKIFGELIRPSV